MSTQMARFCDGTCRCGCLAITPPPAVLTAAAHRPPQPPPGASASTSIDLIDLQTTSVFLQPPAPRPPDPPHPVERVLHLQALTHAKPCPKRPSLTQPARKQTPLTICSSNKSGACQGTGTRQDMRTLHQRSDCVLAAVASSPPHAKPQAAVTQCTTTLHVSSTFCRPRRANALTPTWRQYPTTCPYPVGTANP